MSLIYYDSPFHVTHDKQTADKMCKEIDMMIDKRDIDLWQCIYKSDKFTVEAAYNAFAGVTFNPLVGITSNGAPT